MWDELTALVAATRIGVTLDRRISLNSLSKPLDKQSAIYGKWPLMVRESYALDSAQSQLLAGKLQSLTELMDIISIRVDAQARADCR